MIGSERYRQVLSQYPTGVCVITANGTHGSPVAMVVGSFTSVSLSPPLIGFFPDRKSSSWEKLRECEFFCVNILSAEQEQLCRKLASKDPDKFAGIAHRRSRAGSPVLDGVVAWIECRKQSIHDAGDHEFVLGSVLELDIASAQLPLLFFQGGYGKFSPAAITALSEPGISMQQLRNVDLARTTMEGLAIAIGGRCVATLRAGNQLAIVASAGQARSPSTATLVGQHLPFRPPTGSVIAAWLPSEEVEDWLTRCAPATRSAAREALEAVRSRGYSVGLISEAQRRFAALLEAVASGEGHSSQLEQAMDGLAFDPIALTPAARLQIRLISAPVFDASGVAFALTAFDYSKPTSAVGIGSYIKKLVDAAAHISGLLAGEPGGHRNRPASTLV